MASVRKALRLSEDLAKEIEQLATEDRRDWSSIARDLLEEALRVRRHPGITFASGPSGRRARVAGTGLDVWEVVATYKALGESWEDLQAAYPWLSETQLRAALAYYERYPEEIDRRLDGESQWNEQTLKARFPSLKPR